VEAEVKKAKRDAIARNASEAEIEAVIEKTRKSAECESACNNDPPFGIIGI
jgi:hypothetical protein